MTSNVAAAGDQQKSDDPMKQTMLIIEHKIRNLEKRKIKLDGYNKQLREGILLSDDKLRAASKYNEVVHTLDFAKDLKKQLNTLITKTKTKKNKNNIDADKCQVTFDSKIKEVLIFQNILENIKRETVKQDLLTGQNGAMKLTDEELLNLTNFSKMVSPKRIVGEGKPLFVDQLKNISKHYMKLIDKKPNIVNGTSYAELKECLTKIEKSGYLNYIIQNLNTEEKTIHDNIISSDIQISKNDNNEPTFHEEDNTSISNVPKIESLSNKIETIYFTNNNISENTVEQNPHQNNIASDTVFNTSFDFLQDSELENEHTNVNLNNSIPTQKFTSSLYSNNGPTDDAILKILSSPPQVQIIESSSYKDTKINNLQDIMNVSDKSSWTNKSDNTTNTVKGLPTENWSTGQITISTNNWAVKNNWIEMVESANIQKQSTTQLSQNNTSTNFGSDSNRYTDNINELLQKSVVFNKHDSYDGTTSSNNPKYYQNNYGQKFAEHNNKHYTNSNHFNRNHSNDFNRRPSKHRAQYINEGDYQQGNYKNRSYKNSQYNNSNNYSSRQS